MRTLIYILFAWMLGLSILTAFQYDQIQQSRIASRNDATAIWRGVICQLETTEVQNKKLTPAQHAAAVQFWTNLLVAKVHTTPC